MKREDLLRDYELVEGYSCRECDLSGKLDLITEECSLAGGDCLGDKVFRKRKDIYPPLDVMMERLAKKYPWFKLETFQGKWQLWLHTGCAAEYISSDLNEIIKLAYENLTLRM